MGIRVAGPKLASGVGGTRGGEMSNWLFSAHMLMLIYIFFFLGLVSVVWNIVEKKTKQSCSFDIIL